MINLDEKISELRKELDNQFVMNEITKMLADFIRLKRETEELFFKQLAEKGHKIKNDSYYHAYIYDKEYENNRYIKEKNRVYHNGESLKIQTTNKRYPEKQYRFIVYEPSPTDTAKDIANYLYENYNDIAKRIVTYTEELLKENFDFVLDKNQLVHLVNNHFADKVYIPLINKNIKNKYTINSFIFDESYTVFLKADVKDYHQEIRFHFFNYEDALESVRYSILKPFVQEATDKLQLLAGEMLSTKDYQKYKDYIFLTVKEDFSLNPLKSDKEKQKPKYSLVVPFSASIEDIIFYLKQFVKVNQFAIETKKHFILNLKQDKELYQNQLIRDKIVKTIDIFLNNLQFSISTIKSDDCISIKEIPEFILFGKKLSDMMIAFKDYLLVEDVLNKEFPIQLLEQYPLFNLFVKKDNGQYILLNSLIKEEQKYLQKNKINYEEKNEHIIVIPSL